MKPKGLSAITQTNLGDVAYEQIANALVSGVFQPGERLTIRQLAETLRISSTPVRDAVRRLLHEGALEQWSARDVRVPIITQAHYREIADIRIELEGLAAAKAAERRTDEDLARLKANIEKNEKAIAAGDWVAAVSLNKQFHFGLAEVGQTPVLRGLLQGLWLQIGPAISSFYSKGGRAMIDHHYQVIDAIEQRDSVAARKAIVEDIGDSIENILSNLDQKEASTTPRSED